jgi:hypothetical protein
MQLAELCKTRNKICRGLSYAQTFYTELLGNTNAIKLAKQNFKIKETFLNPP